MWPWGCVLCSAFAVALLAVLRALLRPAPAVPPGPLKGHATPDGAYDAVIVGAGPSGATTAYFLAQRGRRVALLEKESFPRDKYCGNAWCQPAVEMLEEMGVLAELEKAGKVLNVDTGGFVAPTGAKFIGMERFPGKPALRTCGIERIVCDEAIARAAAAAGAELKERFFVDTVPELKDGLWHVKAEDGGEVRGRMLVLADGSNSFTAKKMGLLRVPHPTGFCTRQYFAAGTHNVQADGVLYYPDHLVPGYHAIYKNANGEAGLGTYLFSDISRGGLSERDLIAAHQHCLNDDPFVSEALSADAEESDPIRIAPIRTVPEKSYGNQLLLVGDSAGMVDPLTGEGIQTGMPAGKLAAKTIDEMLTQGCFDERAGRVYEYRWMREFGTDSKYSALMARILAACPFLLDAMAATAQKRGRPFMLDFGAIMTGVRPKTHFMLPHLALPLGVDVVKEIVTRFLLRRGKPPYCSGFAPARTRSSAVRKKKSD